MQVRSVLAVLCAFTWSVSANGEHCILRGKEAVIDGWQSNKFGVHSNLRKMRQLMQALGRFEG